MSYDVWYEGHRTDEDGVADELYWRNHTSNTAPLWRDLGCDIAEFHGRTCREFAAALKPAIDKLMGDPTAYAKYNPANGWGSVDSTLAFLVDLLVNANTYPAAIVRVSR